MANPGPIQDTQDPDKVACNDMLKQLEKDAEEDKEILRTEIQMLYSSFEPKSEAELKTIFTFNTSKGDLETLRHILVQKYEPPTPATGTPAQWHSR